MDIYADEGITGTNTKHRKEFQRMLSDCEAGRIDYIITKSISRFARNTLECLSCVRHLQSLGVQILFEKENIDTGTAFSEMLLTILAAFAQEESRSLSENLKWGIRKRFEAGIDRWTRIYGYTRIGEECYQIVEEEALVVRQIFHMYEHGRTVSQVAGWLNEQGIPSPQGGKEWLPSVVHRILLNEKYRGDIRLQKTYTVDHISHREVRNDGQAVPSYYLSGHHAPLVEEKTWNRVQTIRKLRSQGGKDGRGSGHFVQYPFGELLLCPHCGEVLIQRKIPVQDASRGWQCRGCGRFILRSRIIEDAVLRAYDGIDMQAVRTQTASGDAAVAEAAVRMYQMKLQRPRMESVEYYWLDELVDHIGIGAHRRLSSLEDRSRKNVRNRQKKNAAGNEAVRDDRTVSVYWKCGLESTVFSGVMCDRDMPETVAALYQSYLERRALAEKLQQERDPCSREA